jgi:hypothetical protein
MTLVTEKIDKLLADRARKEIVASLIWMTRTFLFLHYLKIKIFSAAKARIAEQTAQTWAKRIRTDPEWNIFENQTYKGKRA